MPDGPAFAELESPNTAWPKDKEKAKLGSSRTPDGWHFRGYRYDKERNPVFLYNIGVADVTEAPVGGFAEVGVTTMNRGFTITKNTSKSLHFIAGRAL